MLPTLDEARDFLGIDIADDDMVNANVARCLKTAEQLLHGAIGEDVDKYLPNDARSKELVLIYAEDLYSQRGLAAKVSNATRRLVSDMELQLRMELRTAKEAAEA